MGHAKPRASSMPSDKLTFGSDHSRWATVVTFNSPALSFCFVSFCVCFLRSKCDEYKERWSIRKAIICSTYCLARQTIRVRHRPTPCSCNRVWVEHHQMIGHLNSHCAAVAVDVLGPCRGINSAPNGYPISNCFLSTISCKQQQSKRTKNNNNNNN